MIRALLTLSAPLAVAALAAVPLVDAGILSGPAGEPIVVDTNLSHLQRASFSGHCAPLPLAEADGRNRPDASHIRVVALTLRDGESDISVTVREVPAGGSLAGATVVLLLDASGQILFAGNEAALAVDMADEEFASGCAEASAKAPGSV